ncbi:MAG TPA: YggS family pyridoxal phosphate-dependent enzyme [Nitrospiraceae bacterium]|nr:YggS family pyridoxal phosphate-dependent enzyme [Nitrospiraceae bacterium]
MVIAESGSDARSIADHLHQIRRTMEAAAGRVGRDPATIRLLGATKSVDIARIRAAIQAGLTICGENRLQEALPKIDSLKGLPVEWHFIGRLQRRKVKTVVGCFRLIQSVESLELAEEIQRRSEQVGIDQPVLLEVNIGSEASKGGFEPHALERAMPELLAMRRLRIKGLMTIPPPEDDPERARSYFRRLRELAQSLARPEWPTVSMGELSMGMSHDYAVAIEEGATIVRIGTALFGTRSEHP